MDVSANLNVSANAKFYAPPAAGATPVNPAKPPVDSDAGADSYAPSASVGQIAAAVTVSPSPTPGEVVAAVHRLPVSVRYAPSPPPRDAALAAPFDREA